MPALFTLYTYVKSRLAEREERGLVALEYVIMGGVIVALLALAFTAFHDDLQAKFESWV